MKGSKALLVQHLTSPSDAFREAGSVLPRSPRDRQPPSAEPPRPRGDESPAPRARPCAFLPKWHTPLNSVRKRRFPERLAGGPGRHAVILASPGSRAVPAPSAQQPGLQRANAFTAWLLVSGSRPQGCRAGGLCHGALPGEAWPHPHISRASGGNVGPRVTPGHLLIHRQVWML